MKEFWGLPLIVWLIVCLLIAVVYLFVPKKIPAKEILPFSG
ncbi:MAG TPA: hypothetical protein VD908_19570 [Cytophagales bacterium]|nr:hypothetical protein [Cytophagales bacterium]